MTPSSGADDALLRRAGPGAVGPREPPLRRTHDVQGADRAEDLEGMLCARQLGVDDGGGRGGERGGPPGGRVLWPHRRGRGPLRRSGGFGPGGGGAPPPRDRGEGAPGGGEVGGGPPPPSGGSPPGKGGVRFAPVNRVA